MHKGVSMEKNSQTNPITLSNDQNIDSYNLKKRTQKDQILLNKWRDKEAQNNANICFEKESKKKNRMYVKLKTRYNTVSTEDETDLYKATLCSATGSFDPDYARLLINSAINACTGNEKERVNQINGIINTLLASKPKDAIEGMLLARLLVLHNNYMEYMSQAISTEGSHQVLDLRLNRSMKLMRLFNETLDTLNRHRRKGKQKITVQHVHVNDGGQAIVGSSFTAGGQEGL